MLTINRLREAVAEIKAAIPSIKYADCIIVEDDFKKILEERKSSDNIILIAVIPDHNLIGKSDATKMGNYLQFFIFEKNTEKNMKHSEKLDIYNKVQITVKDFINLILEAKSGESDEFSACNLFTDLDEESVDIKPYWDGVQCRGYEIFLMLKSEI